MPREETDDRFQEAVYRFDRVELAGAFGDMGTLLPIVVAMILINQLSPSTVFLAFGIFYLLAGIYYRLPIPIQPLKAVGAVAIAYPTIITESVIGAAGILFGAIMLTLSLSGMVDTIARLFSQAVVRGIQLALGLLFLKKGVELIVAKELFMSGSGAHFAGFPVNLVIGVVVFGLVLWFLNSKRFPAALIAMVIGIIAGIGLGGLAGHSLSFGPTSMK
ncbi:MAG: putative sulfate/molybdate transporter, partial [Desulfofustis sp.]|nr:putative sulfate/molybdate transporter [Desulfofustis sp.]